MIAVTCAMPSSATRSCQGRSPRAASAPDGLAGLETALASQLRRHGLTAPTVTVRTVREPGRLASGKTRRFIPLATEV